MDSGLTAGVFGLVGALIGSTSSIAAIIVQSRYKDKRDRSKQVTDLALAEFNTQVDLVKTGKKGGKVFPVSLYAHHNSLMLQALDEGDLTPERIVEIMKLSDAFCQALVAADKTGSKISN